MSTSAHWCCHISQVAPSLFVIPDPVVHRKTISDKTQWGTRQAWRPPLQWQKVPHRWDSLRCAKQPTSKVPVQIHRSHPKPNSTTPTLRTSVIAMYLQPVASVWYSPPGQVPTGWGTWCGPVVYISPARLQSAACREGTCMPGDVPLAVRQPILVWHLPLGVRGQ